MTKEIMNIGTEGYIDWGKSLSEGTERGYVPKMVIVISSRHHPIQEYLERLNHLMGDSTDYPVLLFINQEKEMRNILAMPGLLFMRNLPVPEIVLAQNFLVGAELREHRRTHSMRSPGHRTPWTPQVRARHQVPTRTFIPRGICRDLHGRPEKTRPTRSRLAKRNGSR